jgi:hypothetical protein
MARTVSNVHSDFAARKIQWSRIRDALEGQDQIKANGEAYLKRPDGMTQTAYDAYKERAQYYPVVERTLRGMSGMVFRHPIKIELPSRLEPLKDAATTDGHSLEVLAENVINEVMALGRYGILVDYPSGNTTATSIPYLATYTAENIMDWRVQFINGMRTLTRVVLKDDFDAQENDDESAEVRLELLLNSEGNYEVRRWYAAGAHREASAKTGDVAVFAMREPPVVPTVGGKPLKSIPFVFINAYDLRAEVSKPPMLDLVDVNLGHYRNSADYEHALYLTSQPTPWAAGAINEKNKPTAIGSGAFWILPEGATCGYLEFGGAGIEAMRQAMLDKEDRMAALGARMILDGKNRNEASDTARMRGRSEMSLMANVVNMAEAGITKALEIASDWVTGNHNDVEVKLNRDWVETKMDSGTLTAMVKAWQAGAMSHQTLWENLQSGEIAPIDHTYEEEKEMIEDEGGDLGLGVNALMVNAALQPPGAPGAPGQPPQPPGAKPKPAAPPAAPKRPDPEEE